MDKRDFLLTAKQFKSIKSGNGIQLSHAQLTNPSKVHRHPVSVNMYPEGLRKLNTSLSKSKGFRMLPDRHFTNEYNEYQGEDDVFEGGDIFKDMKKGFKKAGKTISKTATKTYKDVNKLALKNDVGGVIEDIKAGIGKENTTLILQGALMAAGVEPNSAGVLASSASGAVYSTDFGKQLKGQGKTVLMGTLKGGASEIAKQNDIDFKFDTSSSGGKKFNLKDTIKDNLISSANERAADMKSGGNLFDAKKMSAIVAKTKSQIAKGGSFTGNGFLDTKKLSNSVIKSKIQIGKHGGSFRE